MRKRDLQPVTCDPISEFWSRRAEAQGAFDMGAYDRSIHAHGLARSDSAASSGESIVARWCHEWGDERPSRAVQRSMAQDIDRAIAAALEARAAATARPRKRTGATRHSREVEQLALELMAPGSAPEPAGRARLPNKPPEADMPTANRCAALPARPGSVTEPHESRWVRFDAYLARPWSSANAEALARLCTQPDGLEVALHPEPTNEVDGQAVAIVVDLPEAQVGGFAAAWAPQVRVIGYVARIEARKAALFEALSGTGEVCRGKLHLEPDGWHVHVMRAASEASAAVETRQA